MSQQQHPFAIVLCKFSDAADEPFPRQYYENLFTTAGTGLNNMVDFFRHFSHGRVDIGGSEVFGWFDLPHPRAESRGSGAIPAAARSCSSGCGRQRASTACRWASSPTSWRA